MREPLYEGFKRVGEELRCAACGHRFASESEVPFKKSAAAKIFDESDRPKAARVFAENEAERICRRCAHYVVNPFVQWCGLHKREVEATDTCPSFERKPDRAAPRL